MISGMRIIFIALPVSLSLSLARVDRYLSEFRSMFFVLHSGRAYCENMQTRDETSAD